MRIFAVILIGVFSFLSAGCDVILQPAQQGEWSDSNLHNPNYKATHDLLTETEKPAEK